MIEPLTAIGGALLFRVAKQFFNRLGIPLRLLGQSRVADSGAVAPHINGVHDSQGATHAKAEAEEEADDRRPVEGHNKWSLQGPTMYSSVQTSSMKAGECDARRTGVTAMTDAALALLQ